EVGSGGRYAPLDLTFGTVFLTGTLTASTAGADHAQIASSGLDPSKTVNRTWTVANNGVAFDQFDARFHFAASDLDPGTLLDSASVRRWAGSGWSTLAVGRHTHSSV